MTEQGKKLLLVLVDILCVFVGECAVIHFFIALDNNMAANLSFPSGAIDRVTQVKLSK